MEKIYTRINWENEPSTNTPLDEVDLNRMDYAIDVLDNRIVGFDITKANQSDLLQSVKNVTYNTTTGVFTFTFWDGHTLVADLNIEKIPVSFSMSPEGVITMVTTDGTRYTCDISTLIKQYTFTDSTEIDFQTTESSGNITVTAAIKNGSITGNKLQPNYLADCVTASQTATTAANTAQGDAETAMRAKNDAALYAMQAHDDSTAATDAATSASQSATSAGNSNQNAWQAAQSANAKATEAASSASTASTKATQAAASATSASDSASTATTKANEASQSASTATTKASEAASSATASSNSKLDSEAWAVGTRNGQAVPSTDPTYHNNSKYWSEQTGSSRLVSLQDVQIDNVQDGDALVYDGTSQKWVSEDLSKVYENTPRPSADIDASFFKSGQLVTLQISSWNFSNATSEVKNVGFDNFIPTGRRPPARLTFFVPAKNNDTGKFEFFVMWLGKTLVDNGYIVIRNVPANSSYTITGFWTYITKE